MTWTHLYEHYGNWSESTLAKRIGSLEDYGPAEEITEVADAVLNEAAACRLVRKAALSGTRFDPENILELDGIVDEKTLTFLVHHAIEHGVVFTYENIAGLDGIVDENTIGDAVISALQHGVSFNAQQIMGLDGIIGSEILTKMAKCSNCSFTPEEMDELCGVIDDAALEEIERRQGRTSADDCYIEPDSPDNEKKPGKWFKAVALLGMFGEGHKREKARFRVGDHVRIRYSGLEGTIIDINGKLYTVSTKDGRKVDSYYDSEIEKAW